MASKQLVLAIFDSEAAADDAAEALKAWEKATDDIKLKSVGVLVLDDNGKLKVDKVGRRSTFKGAGIGVILAMATPIGLAAGVDRWRRPGRPSPQGPRDPGRRARADRRASSPAARRPSASSPTPRRRRRSPTSSTSWVARRRPMTSTTRRLAEVDAAAAADAAGGRRGGHAGPAATAGSTTS